MTLWLQSKVRVRVLGLRPRLNVGPVCDAQGRWSRICGLRRHINAWPLRLPLALFYVQIQQYSITDIDDGWRLFHFRRSTCACAETNIKDHCNRRSTELTRSRNRHQLQPPKISLPRRKLVTKNRKWKSCAKATKAGNWRRRRWCPSSGGVFYGV